MDDILKHYGVKGMHWGVRRYQNPDGSLTELGMYRYRAQKASDDEWSVYDLNFKKSKDTVFISGSSKTQDEQSGYFRKELPKEVTAKIDEMIRNRNKIIVGDAPGIDRQVQDYLKSKHYNNVEIYGPGKDKVRYSANRRWKTNLIDAPNYEPGSKEWLAAKDIAMTKAATKGLAIILDQGAAATRRNVQRLIDQSKMADVFQLSVNDISQDRYLSREEINEIIKSL